MGLGPRPIGIVVYSLLAGFEPTAVPWPRGERFADKSGDGPWVSPHSLHNCLGLRAIFWKPGRRAGNHCTRTPRTHGFGSQPHDFPAAAAAAAAGRFARVLHARSRACQARAKEPAAVLRVSGASLRWSPQVQSGPGTWTPSSSAAPRSRSTARRPRLCPRSRRPSIETAWIDISMHS